MNEKYIPLYRKYRPQKLDEVVGQEHIKKALSNSIAMDKISHAYLFTGPRGTGKTSTARIFAKSLNCEKGPTSSPCGECSNCVDITNSTPMDVIEIDAASNRKVEDAQNILEKVMYAPVNSRYKIYIIDEVHMLSTTAFNALLKTLEEPPKNVIFILATTEVHKVLDTIKSRCQRFDFRRITTEDIVKHLRFISDEEKINITDDALFTIAKNSAGGMRDSIALLDQLSVLGMTEAITTDDINSLLGRLSFDILHSLAESILASKPQSAIEILEKIYNSGNEPVQILQNFLDYLKNLLIVKNCRPEVVFELTQLNDGQIKDLKKQSEDVETQQIISLSEKCAGYIKEVKTTNNPRLWLEIAIIDMANLTENTKLEDLQNRLMRLEGGAMPPASAAHQSVPVRPADIKEQFKKNIAETKPEPAKEIQRLQKLALEIKNSDSLKASTVQEGKPEPEVTKTPEKKEPEFSPMPQAQANDSDDILTLWGNLLANVQSAPTRALLKQWARPVELNPEHTIISVKNEIYLNQFVSGSKKAVLQNAVDELFGQKDTSITVRLPQPGDAVIEGNIPLPKPKAALPPQMPVNKPRDKNLQKENAFDVQTPQEVDEILNDSADEADEEKEYSDNPEIKSARFSEMHSDTVNMVMDIFDGKIID